MIRLDEAGTRALSLITAQNGASVTVGFSDYTIATGAYVDTAPTCTTISSATTTSICATPASGVIRDIDYIAIYNTFAGSHAMTLQITSGSGGPFVQKDFTLLDNESMNYSHGTGYQFFDANGNLKESLAAATNWAVTVLTVATKMSAAYVWTSWNPSDVIGTYTNAANSAASSYADGTYFTQSNSSGTVTLTFVKAGSYVVNLTVGIQNAAIYTYEDFKATTGGTATAYRTNNIQLGAGDSVNDLDFKTTETIGIVATAGQTLTILPAFRVVGAGTTGQYLGSAGYTVIYAGG